MNKKAKRISWSTSMNDETVEGLRYLNMPAITVQFHPETKPVTAGKVDLIGEFLDRCVPTGTHPQEG